MHTPFTRNIAILRPFVDHRTKKRVTGIKDRRDGNQGPHKRALYSRCALVALGAGWVQADGWPQIINQVLIRANLCQSVAKKS